MLSPMNSADAAREVPFDCHACAYACRLSHPFDEWIWCDHPTDRRPLNLANDADCRHAEGGRAVEANRDSTPPGEHGETSEQE